MKILLILFLILINSIAMADSPIIWDGDYALNLASAAFEHNNGYLMGVCTADPTTGGGFVAPVNSVCQGAGALWYKNGVGNNAWTNVLTGVTGWGLTGNSGTSGTAGTDFVGTTDAQDFLTKVNSVEYVRSLSTPVGARTIFNASSAGNTGVGFKSAAGVVWTIYPDNSRVDINFSGGGNGGLLGVDTSRTMTFGYATINSKLNLANDPISGDPGQTSPASDNLIYSPVISTQQKIATNNDYGGWANYNQGNYLTAGVFGINEGHLAASSGHIDFYTSNAGTVTKWLTLKSDGTLQAQKYGAGVAHFDASGNISSSAVSLTADVSGILPVPSGGIGVGTETDHGVLIGRGTSPVTAIAVGATNTVLHGNTGADPTYGSVALADISTIAAGTILGNNTGGASVPIALTKAQDSAMINAFSGYTAGAGTVGNADSVQTAIQKLDGNIALDLPSALTSGKIYVGSLSGVASPVTMSNDATMSNTGAITLKNTGAGAGSCTNCNITADAQGRITAYANGAGGGSTLAISTKSSGYTLTNTDDVILCNGTLTITLHAVSGATIKPYRFKNIGGGTCTFLASGSDKVDGDVSIISTAKNQSFSLIPDGGAAWYVY